MFALAVVGVAAIAAAIACVRMRQEGRARAVAHAAHEVRGALTDIELCASSLARTGGNPVLDDSLETIRIQIERGSWAIDDLEAVRSRHQGKRGTSEPVDLACLVRRRARAWQRLAQLCNATFELEWAAGDAQVSANVRRLCQALDNLVSNAIRHGGGRILLRVLLDGGRIRIEIHDGGQGLPSPAAQPASRSSFRHGHGLSIARTAIECDGGRLDPLDDGVSVELPVHLSRLTPAAA